MNEEAADAGSSSSGPTLFKKRVKARGSLAATASAPPSRSSQLKSNEEEANEGVDEENVSVQRTAGIGQKSKSISRDSKVKKSRSGNTPSSSLSFGDEAAEPAFALKKSALAQAAKRSKETAEFALPDSLEQASIAESSNGYSASTLAALKASTPARRRMVEEEGDRAHQEMIDPAIQLDVQGNDLTRLKFGADFLHDGIPNQALVTAAKERRRRAAGDGEAAGSSEDFISLRDSNGTQGPHPESRLQREEDDLGSGEEEFAEFTGATERVALGSKAIKQAKKRERDERREAMDIDEDDDSGQEWERAQMDRIDVSGSRKQREKREKSPFRPAPIPMTAPLPTLSSTSARLANKVAALDSSIRSHGQVIDDAVRQLQQLEGDEKRNKASIEVMGEKEAWFRELEKFIIGLSAFLEEKMPRLEEIEGDCKGLLVERAQRIEKVMAITMTDEVCLFHGVPASKLFPTASDAAAAAAIGCGERYDDGEPADEGDALSSVREARRSNLSSSHEASLSPNDEAAFQVAHKDIQRRLRQLLDDVKAPEFTDPAVRLDSNLHPSSLVARFQRWRKLYPDEYASAWGGLTLAGIWDFWVRREMCGWDLVKLGGQRMNEFHWYKELSRYAVVRDQAGTEAISITGGDDEVISHVLCNTVISRIIDANQARSFNPWSVSDCQSMIDLTRQISNVLEQDNVRLLSLTSSILQTFALHIDALVDCLSTSPISPPPPFDPRTPSSLLSFLERVKVLLFNLMSLDSSITSSERPFYLDLIDRLVGKLIWNLLGKARETGGKLIAQEILQRCSKKDLLRVDVRARLAAMAHN